MSDGFEDMSPAAHIARMEGYGRDLERALVLARERYPEADPARHAAFANSVAYAVHGLSGGYGGPSTREHVACGWMGERRPWTYDKATAELLKPEGLIFGPVQDSHRDWWQNYGNICFDEDPADIPALER